MYVSFISFDSPWIAAVQILLVGLACSVFLYFATGWIFRFTGVERLIQKLLGHTTRIGHDPLPRAIGKYIAVFVYLFGSVPLITKKWGKGFLERMGSIRYYFMIFLMLGMMSLPIKMYLRWFFNLKYIISMPEFELNL